jgi:uncharacterized membrane-anchored protein YitT (DUF2179 family)
MSDDNELEEIEQKYGHLLVVGMSVLLLVATVLSAFISHWFALRLQSDFWPVDKSTVGPNILASAIQAIIVVTVMALCYPPFRKALDKAATKHKNEIKQHLTDELSEVHAKMDHIIKNHPNIPDYKKETK